MCHLHTVPFIGFQHPNLSPAKTFQEDQLFRELQAIKAQQNRIEDLLYSILEHKSRGGGYFTATATSFHYTIAAIPPYAIAATLHYAIVATLHYAIAATLHYTIAATLHNAIAATLHYAITATYIYPATHASH